jgi:hypothetical protein
LKALAVVATSSREPAALLPLWVYPALDLLRQFNLGIRHGRRRLDFFLRSLLGLLNVLRGFRLLLFGSRREVIPAIG